MYVVDNSTMREIDRRTIAAGISGLELMERAGAGIAEWLTARPDWLQGCTLLLCGRGNNGGDGLVVARHLHEGGHRVCAICVAGQRSEEAAVQFGRAVAAGVEVVEVGEDQASRLLELCRDRGGRLVVDALLGTGFRPPLREGLGQWCEVLGGLGRDVVAVDGPTGLSGDDGSHDRRCPRARWTLSLGAPKWGLISPLGRDRCGRLEILDLGFPPEIVEEVGRSQERVAEWVDAEWVWRRLGRIRMDAHKYSVGTVAVCGASVGMSGAVTLACHGALRAGAGLVEALVPRSVQPVVDAQCVETLVRAAAEDSQGGLALESAGALMELARRRDALVLGPGAGRSPETRSLFRDFLTLHCASLPMVVDADALHALAADELELSPSCILTPHSGELRRLEQVSQEEIADRRVEIVGAAARRRNAVLLHKGAPTLVAAPEGRLAVIGAGGPGLATAGSGDVLAGVCAAFLAAGLPSFEAAAAGAWVHGAAGDRAEALRGTLGVVATDLPAAVALVLREIEGLPQ